MKNKIKPKESELNEQFITEYADIVDWFRVSQHINIPSFSDKFFQRFKSEIEWDVLADHNTSITTEFAHEWEKEIGSKNWYENGLLHREDEPAVTLINGNQFWYNSGKIHREDGPAAIYTSGGLLWYNNGKLHVKHNQE